LTIIVIFGQKLKFWSKIEVLAKNHLVKSSNFGQKSKFWPKIFIWSKVQILVKKS